MSLGNHTQPIKYLNKQWIIPQQLKSGAGPKRFEGARKEIHSALNIGVMLLTQGIGEHHLFECDEIHMCAALEMKMLSAERIRAA